MASGLVLSARGCARHLPSPPAVAVAPAAPASGVPTPPGPAAGAPGAPGPQAAQPPPSVGFRRLAAVGVGQAADFGGGVLASVERLTPVHVDGQGPGTSAGPGVDVAVAVRNGSGASFDLLGVAVTASYGDGVPAVPVPVASGPPLRGTLPPGGSASGRYAFRLAPGTIPTLTLELTSASAPNVIVVRAG